MADKANKEAVKEEAVAKEKLAAATLPKKVKAVSKGKSNVSVDIPDMQLKANYKGFKDNDTISVGVEIYIDKFNQQRTKPVKKKITYKSLRAYPCMLARKHALWYMFDLDPHVQQQLMTMPVSDIARAERLKKQG